jgi:hypothetical protein
MTPRAIVADGYTTAWAANDGAPMVRLTLDREDQPVAVLEVPLDFGLKLLKDWEDACRLAGAPL